MGGAINRVGATDTAYAERSAPWMSSVDGNWENPADNAANIAWVRESFKQISPYSNGVTYTSFTGQADETASVVKAVMEAACEPHCELSVPLVVETGRGLNWDEAH